MRVMFTAYTVLIALGLVFYGAPGIDVACPMLV
jgi:hypothetical protein